MATERAVFLDRDGVICRNRSDHVKSWEEFSFLAGTLRALARLAASPLRILIVNNQSVINRGIVPVSVVEQIHTRMADAIRTAGGRVDRVYYCPHRPDEHCSCRKPQPGLLERAAEELDIDLTRSFAVGDALTDVQAAAAVGCQPYLVLTGRGWQQWRLARREGLDGFEAVPTLGWAVSRILSNLSS